MKLGVIPMVIQILPYPIYILAQFPKIISYPQKLHIDLFELLVILLFMTFQSLPNRVTNQAIIEKTSSDNLPYPLFSKEGEIPPFRKGREGGISSGV